MQHRAVVDDIDLCECIGVLHERRKMLAARNQPGQIEDIFASISGKTHP
jgi:hypothetical protein